MKHFAAEEWSDFVRRLVPESLQAAMESHLRTGCSRCNSMAKSLGELERLSVAEQSAAPPAGLVESAMAIFPPHTPMPVLTLPKLLSRLLTMNSEMPMALGFRTALNPPCHAVYQVSNMLLEIRLQGGLDQLRSSLVGMIGPDAVPASPSDDSEFKDLPVYLLSKKKVLAQTTSNQFGEFLLEFEPRNDIRLCMPLVHAGGRIDIPLGRLLENRK
jgi:hypothetical protein